MFDGEVLGTVHEGMGLSALGMPLLHGRRARV